MVSTFPLFPGLPGGPELLIVLLVMVLVLGIPTLLVAAAAFFGLRHVRGGDTREERVAELEREVRELRARVRDDAASDGRGSTDADAHVNTTSPDADSDSPDVDASDDSHDARTR